MVGRSPTAGLSVDQCGYYKGKDVNPTMACCETPHTVPYTSLLRGKGPLAIAMPRSVEEYLHSIDWLSGGLALQSPYN